MFNIAKKTLLLFFIIFSGCRTDADYLEEEELIIQFENEWWQIVETRSLLLPKDVIYCFYFDSYDEVVYYMSDDWPYQYYLSEYRFSIDAYILRDWDVYVKVATNEDSELFVDVWKGILKASGVLGPCEIL